MRGLGGLVVALVVTAISGALVAGIASQAGQLQPWSNELSDNFIFVRSLPIVLAIGVAYGLIAGWLYPSRASARRADGAVRRFSPATVLLHALITIGFVVALPTGLWQYLGGILDSAGPLPVYLYYRLHYIGASVVLVSIAAFLTYWWMTGDRSLLIPRRDIARHVRGFAQELPPVLRARFASLLRVDVRQNAGSPGRFTFYEKVFQFPGWTFALTLITVTGLVKLLRYTIPVPGGVLLTASTFHVAAMVLILILLLDHIRYYIARWPFMVAIATGWLPQRRGGVARQAPEGASAAGSTFGAES